MNYRKIATALGWFSIGLGVAEIMASGKIGKALRMEKREGLLRTYGLREIATGIGILTQQRQAPWLWARVGGDLLDLATLGTSAAKSGSKAPVVAAAAVAGVTALDLLCGQRLSARV
ncbi:hypothetical protein [Geobacter sp. DSM 9736]|uniref:hypothetical protein n=1 Tax=Geobacter sp. DSM 9736 TaxID=1277350 RepID=UPI000B502B43|nr:hypothetical protein [Geobacter sp. DSM 9736]SNB44619.1 hypothetical protein SAMN06269301_0006 [Geobacter sp. DSM 9736]